MSTTQDSRPLTFLREAAIAIEAIWQRPEVASVSVGLDNLHDDVQKAAQDIERMPSIANEGRFYQLVGSTSKCLSLAAELLPDFKASPTYASFLDASYQVGMFIAGE